MRILICGMAALALSGSAALAQTSQAFRGVVLPGLIANHVPFTMTGPNNPDGDSNKTFVVKGKTLSLVVTKGHNGWKKATLNGEPMIGYIVNAGHQNYVSDDLEHSFGFESR